MVNYTLRAHAYNVDLNVKTFRHSGYDLIVTNDDGSQHIYTIDFSSTGLNNATININDAPAYTVTNGDETLLWYAPLSTSELLYWQPSAKTLLEGSAALEAFNKIKLDAALSNLAGLDYTPFGDERVCNTATEYWAQRYIPGYEPGSIFEGMDGDFYGSNGNYVNAGGYQQAQKIGFINQLVESLAKIGAIDDALSSTEPYISDKYLQLLEPLLANDFHCLYDPREFIEDFLKRIYEAQPIGIAILPMLDIISKIKDLFETAEGTRSPLVVDLDGDGVETVTAEGGVYFDHDANGFKENSGWVGQDDGILVRDINGNGTIDNGTELFGNNSVLSSGEKAVNGFEALKDLDDNNDGIFDRNDKAWNEVKIWQDKNFNGNYSNIKSANPVFV